MPPPYKTKGWSLAFFLGTFLRRKQVLTLLPSAADMDAKSSTSAREIIGMYSLVECAVVGLTICNFPEVWTPEFRDEFYEGMHYFVSLAHPDLKAKLSDVAILEPERALILIHWRGDIEIQGGAETYFTQERSLQELFAIIQIARRTVFAALSTREAPENVAGPEWARKLGALFIECTIHWIITGATTDGDVLEAVDRILSPVQTEVTESLLFYFGGQVDS